MNKQEQKKKRIALFIKRLGELDAGEKAQLKRNVGNRLEESHKVIGLFFRILPPNVSHYNEQWYFLVATLYPLAKPATEPKQEEKRRSFGLTLRRLRAKGAEKNKDSGIDRRFEALLDANEMQIAFRLRQMIALLKTAEIPIDWHTLLADLTGWTHSERYIQQKWARHYYERGQQNENDAADTAVQTTN